MHSKNNTSRRRESHPAPITRRGSTELLPPLATTGRLLEIRARRTLGARRTRPRLALLGIPLAIVAALMANQWWAVLPLTICAWWWSQRDWAWYWLLALLRGIAGFAWATVGVSALSTWPDVDPVTGTVWSGATGMLVAISSYVDSRQE